jgi:hypothetical protein
VALFWIGLKKLKNWGEKSHWFVFKITAANENPRDSI